ncbi:tyrosine-protein kinase receptor TYRO3 isoform X2 [Phycodurus eques]|uniref:tyrosine-protein kinase receptor TYRO3 isoform X2 n=1 Tax=Phycodurus eques TaxID=693459 RepID=UPI002ACE1845|nr:tyrosine-protein kinase receptor TYRO3 isoform X2 [Phycodurus eques]
MSGLAVRLVLVAVLARDAWCVIGGVTFSRHPGNRTASQGNGVRLGCAVEGLDEPDVVWMKDGARLLGSDQMFVALGEKHWETYHSVKSVQQQDAGQYWCEVDFHGRTFASERAWITVEGVPHFVREPQDVATLPGEPFNLTCGAVGPPEPVEVLWWLGGVREGGATPSPSVLRVPGVNDTLKFYCEARNARGISVSRTGTVYIKASPAAPVGLKVAEMLGDDALLSWQPGFTGHSELSACVVQLQRASPGGAVFPESPVPVPPHAHVLPGLTRHSNYSVRVACLNEVGASPFSAWTRFLTPESVPSAAPRNLTFDSSRQRLSLQWAELRGEELQGELLAYKVQWILGGEQQVSVCVCARAPRWLAVHPVLRACVCVRPGAAALQGTVGPLVGRRPLLQCVRPGVGLHGCRMRTLESPGCGSARCGCVSRQPADMPMTQKHANERVVDHAGGRSASAGAPVERNRLWVGVLFALLALTVSALLFSVFARRRGKERHFGWVFPPAGTDAPVSFTAARSFNRNAGDPHFSTLGSLGISEDLQNKLKDVLIPETLLTLGHMLGKGEFGSVREASLKTDDSRVRKVAVKVLKSDITSSGDIERCLKEAAYMKDFRHPNVIRLIGVSLHRRHARRLPVPMVVLPFMKHGDLHTFLHLSRLGDWPFDLSAPVLVRFMLDVARGMEYLSARNIIHRDLAARNCMLDENMVVCVADFGLSKKIYSGDYYRQGSVSKLPVKWIALESLADNVYTTQSDVWSFGVTMWEVMTRGQTPYPGVENSEIYEYLIRGERLKKPAECRRDIYDVMHSCWSPVPKCRPTFQHLAVLLEELRLSFLRAPPYKESLHYVNLDGEGREANMAPESRRADGRSAPWTRGAETDERDWLTAASGAATAIGGGDYRYMEDLGGGARGGHGAGVDRLDEDDDAVIHV